MRGLRGLGIQGLVNPVFSAGCPGGFQLPYSVDFTALSDGNLPFPWTAPATWQISTAKAVCAPVTLSGELLTDPGLEANYTAGLCDTLLKSLASTCTEETIDVHGGGKAQSVDWTVDNAYVYRATITSVDNKFVLVSTWGKKTGAGTTRFSLGNSADAGVLTWTPNITTSWSQFVSGRLCITGVTLQVLRNSSASNPDIAIADDQSLKTYTETELFATLPPSSPNVSVKAGYTSTSVYRFACGVIARSDSQTNPQNYLLGVIACGGVTSPYARLYKCVAGDYSLLTSGVITYVAGKLIEIRCSGTTVQLFYNGTQVGTDQTVSDAGIVNNSIHGMMSLDGSNSLNSFFVTAV